MSDEDMKASIRAMHDEHVAAMRTVNRRLDTLEDRFQRIDWGIITLKWIGGAIIALIVLWKDMLDLVRHLRGS